MPTIPEAPLIGVLAERARSTPCRGAVLKVLSADVEWLADHPKER